jgi:predicted PurR-regulated permease PerM
MTLKAVPPPVDVRASAPRDPDGPREDGGAARRESSSAEPTVSMPVDIRSVALTLLAAIAVVLMLQYAQAMVIPIVLGVLISYALDPIVSAMARRKIPRSIGAAFLLIILVGAGGWLLYGLRTQASAIVEELPQAARRLRHALENDRPETARAIEQVQRAASELQRAADAAAPPPPATGVQRVQVEAPPFRISEYLMYGSLGVAAAIGQVVLIIFLVYFLLASGDLYRRKLVKLAGPSLAQKKIPLQILSDIDRQISSFLLVQLFTSTLVAVATWLAFRAIGLQQAAMWGILAGVFNSIPYFGPVIVSGATAAVAALQFGNVPMTLLVSGVALAITSLEGFLLTPWLTSRTARMNAVAIFVGLLFWGWVWNVWGMLLAVPMLVVIKAVCDHVEDFKPISELLGE